MVDMLLLVNAGERVVRSLWLDFVLSLLFFVSLVYAVLRRRLDHPRAAAAVSLAIGLGLSIGLVTWEFSNGWSIRDLGPIAVGFTVLVLGGVIFQAFRLVGGSWSGAAFAIGACLLVGVLLGVAWPFDRGVMQTGITVAFVVGIVAFLVHQHRNRGARPGLFAPDEDDRDLRRSLPRLYRERCLAGRVSSGLERARRDTATLGARPERAGDIMPQLNRILPDEGALTKRLSRLRSLAHRVRRGHVARIEQLRSEFERVPRERRKQLARRMRELYAELSLDTRITRLDTVVAENERQVRALTHNARTWLSRHDYPRLANVLDHAAKLQRHNARLMRLIEQTERRLLRAARTATAAPRTAPPS